MWRGVIALAPSDDLSRFATRLALASSDDLSLVCDADPPTSTGSVHALTSSQPRREDGYLFG